MKLSSLILCGFAALIGVFSAMIYFIAPEKALWIYGGGTASIISSIFVVFAERKTVLSALKSRTGLHGMNSVALSAIVLGIIAFLNMLAFNHKHRFDVTEGSVYTLAPQTRKIVSNLPREIALTAFFQSESPQRESFKILTDGYLGLSDKIKIKFIDPDKNPAITKRYGITAYGSVVFESGKQETVVKNPTEENLTNAIIKVIRDEAKKFYFLTGHGEKKIDGASAQGYSAISEKLKKDGYLLKELMLLKTGKVPEDADLLIIAGPIKKFSEEEALLIENYLDQGGAALALLDPQIETGLESLLVKWGVEVNSDVVIDPFSKLYGGDAAAPIVDSYAEHDITRDFGLATIFPILRSVKAIDSEKAVSEEILFTGENSWAEFDVNSQPVRFDQGKDIKGPVPVAVVSSKKHFHKEEASENDGVEEKHEKQGKIAVVGDSDFAGNNYLNFSGNGDFFLNIASYLAEEESLISIRPRSRKNNPLQLTNAQGSFLFFACVIVFPASVAFAGIFSWWKRRRL